MTYTQIFLLISKVKMISAFLRTVYERLSQVLWGKCSATPISRGRRSPFPRLPSDIPLS